MPLKTWNTKADFDAAYSDAPFEQDGRPGGTVPIRMGYSRAAWFDYYGKLHPRTFVEVMGWTAGAIGWSPDDRVVVVGCGFGWSVEGFEALGLTQVVGCDTSAWVHTVKGDDEAVDVGAALDRAGVPVRDARRVQAHARAVASSGVGPRSRPSRGVVNDDPFTDDQARRRILASLTGDAGIRPDWVITESVLESLRDAEAVAFADTLRAWGTNLVHCVWPKDDRFPQDAGYNWHTLAEWRALLGGDVFVSMAVGRSRPRETLT